MLLWIDLWFLKVVEIPIRPLLKGNGIMQKPEEGSQERRPGEDLDKQASPKREGGPPGC